MTIDDIDRQILISLQQEGRKTASQIAKELHLTVPTITERIRKLQEGSVIQAGCNSNDHGDFIFI